MHPCRSPPSAARVHAREESEGEGKRGERAGVGGVAPEHVKEAAAALAPVEAVATAPVPGRGGGRGSGLQDQLLLPLLPPQRSN